MTDKVIRSYFGVYRWEKVKPLMKNRGWWFYFYIAIVFPFISQIFENKRFAALYYTSVLPVLWEMMESQLLPMGLSKIQYLCPMEEKERKEYIWGMYWLKVLLPLVLYLICQSVMLSINWVHPAEMMLETIVLFFFALAIQINPAAPKPQKGNSLYGIGLWRVFAGISGILIMFLLLFFEDTDWESALLPVIGCILVGWQLLITAKMLTYLKPAVLHSLHYENTLGTQPQ